MAGLKHGPRVPMDGSFPPHATAPNTPNESRHDEAVLCLVDEARLAWHSQRIKEGMERARQRGHRIGRPRVSDGYRLRPDFIIAEERINHGELPPRRAARELGMGYNTLKRLLATRDSEESLTESYGSDTQAVSHIFGTCARPLTIADAKSSILK
ncbi:MAG: hypothetical protein ABIH46_07795 [Chloroflexota bacterium]